MRKSTSYADQSNYCSQERKMRQTFILDASYDFMTHTMGIGIVIHESDKPQKSKNGIIIDEISESYIGVRHGKGEMLAIYRALEIASQRGYKHIRIRSDYNYLRKSLKQSHASGDGHDRVDIYGKIMRLSRTFERIDFGYKPRRKNQMAHNLARVAAKGKDPVFRQDFAESFEPKQGNG